MFERKKDNDIDLLFYGNINPSWIPYRSNMLDKIEKLCLNINIKFVKGTFHERDCYI